MSTDRDGAGGAPVRLLLADDDPLVRAGLVSILATAPDLEVRAEAQDGREALDLLERHRVDVALLDIQMPRLDGLSTLERIRERHPRVPVMILTTFSDEEYIERAVGSGAVGFVLKSDDPEHLIAGVRAVAGGGAWFSPTVARWLVRREATAALTAAAGARAAVEELTERQRDLLAQIGRGRSNAEIARALHLSEGTVKQYVSGLLAALGVTNRVRAAILAHESGLVGPGDQDA